MIIKRIDDYFTFLEISDGDRELGVAAANKFVEKSQGMMDVNDYLALAATALHFKPKKIFEVGTYLGVTSDFFLSILPDCEVISIAYINPRWRFLGRQSNNSELTKSQVGSLVDKQRRDRFTQLYGDSHKLDSQTLLKEYGAFDLVLIDGDHSAAGVALDTELAKQIVTDSGVICWHDANPKPTYMDVRHYLENELALPAIATQDNYIGGIAVWSRTIADDRLAGAEQLT